MPGPKNAFPLDGANYPGGQIIVGSFLCNGASAPTVVVPSRNAKFTISAPSTGSYTITFTDGIVPGAIGAVANLADTAANSTKRAFVSNWANLQTVGTLTLQTQSTAGTDANIALVDAVLVTFVVFISSSSLVNA